jgi:hypothetical protein
MDNDLFTYPHRAGYKEPTTSKEAAERIEGSGKAKTIRERLLALFEAGEMHTIYSAGRALNVAQFSLRPRFSELHSQGKIRKLRMTEGEQGVRVWIWVRA